METENALQKMVFRESETIELKKSTSELKEAIISIAAILNKHGNGSVYFGVKNDGEAVGQQVTENTIRGISKAISDNIEPKIYPEIKEVELEGKKCVQVNFSGNDLPYFAFGRAFMRVGDEDKKLSAKVLEGMILAKNKGRLRWDSEQSDHTLGDVNEGILKGYIQKANGAGRISFPFDSSKSVLERLGLVKNGKLLRAAEVLFCDKNSLRVQLAVFAGNDKLTFLDIQLLEGNIFDLIEKSEQYLKEKMNWRVKIPGLRRQEIPEVPIRAIREALVNSFCHRDYAVPESNYIAIYKDGIEISNPGSFPEGLTPQDFIKGKHRSVLRNPLIAEILYKSKEIEHWGSGLKEIFKECKAGNVKVRFKPTKYEFTVRFARPKSQAVTGSEKSSEKSSEKIAALMRANRAIGAKEIAQGLGISQRAVEKHIAALKQKGVLKRIGPDKGGYWEIAEGKTT